MPFRSRVSLASVLSTSTTHNETSVKHQGETEDGGTPQAEMDDMQLPPPVLQESGSQRIARRKKTRISLGLRARFDQFLRKLGSGTAPSTSSAIDESTGDSMSYGKTRGIMKVGGTDVDEEVDEVVVDREWSGEIKSSVHSGDHGGQEKSGGSGNGVGGYGGTNTDRDSLAFHVDGFWASNTLLVYLRYRIWPYIYGFFATHFVDEKSEAHYRKENWFLRKSLAIWASAFYIVNWALAAGFIPHPANTSDTVFYYAVAPALTFPIFFMVVYDFPRDRPIFYQVFLTFSTWMWSTYQLFFMFFCGFYGSPARFNCEGKDFLLTFYYTCAFQTIALFGLGFNRFPALIGVVAFFGLACGIVVPEKTTFLRNLFNFLLFQAFLLYVHYMRENAERRLYTLRDQLKIQFRATQKAQVNERKAADSKRRLTSYVFHEVRVPLNTALLAVQNMEASGAVAKSQDIEFKALEGSLSMMSKVLNDVLDFNRMDSGRFESVLKPYAFHQVMRSLFVPLRMATDARGLEFITDLDPAIDEVARAALHEYQGQNGDIISRLLQTTQDEDGIVVGDETRLRQIITNLASNACKFTPAGGKLIITTKLVLPTPSRIHASWPELNKESKDLSPPGHELPSVEINGTPQVPSSPHSPDSSSENKHGLSATLLNQHDVLHSRPPPLEWIVVRIEVTDTGCGIRQKDMAQTKLFSAFNQTEMGRQQGGKGTGLGLALVRQIVKRSGGRLGVRSKVNEGSTFWVELPLGVGAKVAAGSNTPETRAAVLDDDTSKHPKTFRPRPPLNPKNFSPVPVPTSPEKSGSALHSIMEQGGLVELSTKPEEHTRVPTRTIGDFSTATQATRSHSSTSTSAASIAPPTTPSDRPALLEEKSDSTVKPTHLDLPKPATFSIPETGQPESVPASTVASPASEKTNGSAMSAAASSATAPSVTYEQGMRVLVVDDDPLTRKLMTRMLTRLGCKVTTAENGEIALDLILNPGATRPTPSSEDTGSTSGLLDGTILSSDEPRYSVVFLDNQMPVMSGLQAVGKLRRRGRKDFVVGVTGNALLSDQEEYLEAGVDHVLTKPVLEKSIKAMLAIADERRKRGVPIHDQP